MTRYSLGLSKKLTELNGGYEPNFFSIGRLAVIIANPYNLYPGLSNNNREEIVKIIRGEKNPTSFGFLSQESFKVAYTFINTLLFKEEGFNLPDFNDSNSFKKIETYRDYLQNLVTMRKSTASRSAHDNIEQFKKSPNTGFFKNKLEDKLIMKSFEPKSSQVVRVSFRTKTRESFVEKTLERFIKFNEEIYTRNYNISGKQISGKEIFMEYFSRFKSSGLDLYDFYARENPQYLTGSDILEFKEKFIAIFPIDHDGGKIVVKTVDDANKLAQKIYDNNLSNYAGFPIHLRLCENNIKSKCKDRSYTLAVGGMKTFTQSGITEIKIQDSNSVIESEFGSYMHLIYKEKKIMELVEKLQFNKDYQKYYLNLCNAFQINPRLLS